VRTTETEARHSVVKQAQIAREYEVKKIGLARGGNLESMLPGVLDIMELPDPWSGDLMLRKWDTDWI